MFRHMWVGVPENSCLWLKSVYCLKESSAVQQVCVCVGWGGTFSVFCLLGLAV